MKEHLDWRWVLPTSIFGLGAVWVGLALGDFSDSAWSSVAIEVGAAAALAGLLVALERRMVRRAVADARTEATAVAEAAVQRAAGELQARVQRLEDLERGQAEGRARRRSSDSALIDSVRSGALSSDLVATLLRRGLGGYFDRSEFRVRTSNNPQCPVLYLGPLRATDQADVWLAFASPTDVEIDDDEIEYPIGDVRFVVPWTPEDPASDVAGLLEEDLARTNTALNDFDLAYAFRSLANSLEVMLNARLEVADSPRRLEGNLRILINEHWALTSAGLESLDQDICFPVAGGGFTARGGHVFEPRHIIVPDPAPDLAGWDEAAAWVRDREGIRVGNSRPEPPKLHPPSQ